MFSNRPTIFNLLLNNNINAINIYYYEIFSSLINVDTNYIYKLFF